MIKTTFCIKTIHRPRCCAALVRSIRRHYGDDRPAIHVLDDGQPELRFSMNCPDEAAMVDRLIETEFDIGLSAGRSRLLDEGDTPIVVFADDDHLVTDRTRLPELVRKLNRHHDLDLLAGRSNDRERPKLMRIDGKTLRIPHGNYKKRGNIRWCHYVGNCFVAYRDILQAIRWDDSLKVEEHWDFFLAMQTRRRACRLRHRPLVQTRTRRPARLRASASRIPEGRTTQTRIGASDLEMKRVIAVLNLPPRQAIKNTRASFEAAAERWDAELLWIDRNLHPVHPFWQKMFVCEHVQSLFGDAHVLQLDNDMVIRSDCPSPFELVDPKQFGLVAERQCAQNRIDDGGWQRRAHEVGAERCNLRPAFTWLHPNGGLYLYETSMYAPMFRRIQRHLIPNWGAHDQATDESLIINQLFNDHPGYIEFLPGDFNVSVQQAPEWAANPVMQSYIYHFIGKTKPHLEACRWRRFDPPELPFEIDDKAKRLIREWGKAPPAKYDIGPIFTPRHAANLLAVYPKLIVTGEWSHQPQRLDPRLISHAETTSSHLVLTRFLLRLGVNARRFKLRVTEDAVASTQLAGA